MIDWKRIEEAPESEIGESGWPMRRLVFVWGPKIGGRSGFLIRWRGQLHVSVSNLGGNAVDDWGVTHYAEIEPPMTDLSPLIARLEQAAEGSRELSDEVLRAVYATDPEPMVLRFAERAIEAGTAPDPTRSLDDALALVGDGWQWLVRTDEERGALANLHRDHDEPNVGDPHWPAWAATPALAVCAAILRTKET